VRHPPNILVLQKASSSGHVRQGISRGSARVPSSGKIRGKSGFRQKPFPKNVFCSQLMTRRCVLGPSVSRRKAREGWPLLTVETEMNGDSKSTYERGPPLVVRVCTRYFCSALAALVGPLQTIFFLTAHYFNSFVPIAQQAGQAAVLGHLSLSVCLWSHGWF
jgi:hypothetical protein